MSGGEELLAFTYGGGSMVASIQETMLERCDARIWSWVRCGSLEGHLAVNALGCSGGLLMAWSDHLFSKEDEWLGLCQPLIFHGGFW